MKHILRLVNYYNKTITSHTTNIFYMDVLGGSKKQYIFEKRDDDP